MSREVFGPPHCDDHHTHVIGCLDCAAEVCAVTDLDLGDFLDEMERIGWPKQTSPAASKAPPVDCESDPSTTVRSVP